MQAQSLRNGSLMRSRCGENLTSTPLVLVASTRPGRRQEWPDQGEGGPSSGGTWWPESLPSPTLQHPAPGLESREVLALPENLDGDEAFVPFFFFLQEEQKWKQQNTRELEQRGKEGRKHAPKSLMLPGCDDIALAQRSLSEDRNVRHPMLEEE